MSDGLSAFAERLAAKELSETELAIALLWFLEETGSATEVTAMGLANMMNELSLRGRVNISRLAKQLAIHRDVISARGKSGFKLRLGSKARLAERYGPIPVSRAPKIDPRVLAPEDFEHTRPYMKALVEQINGSFQFGFNDACAVLCRRLMETLLIEAFEQSGHGAAIRTSDGYLQLSDMIGLATSGRYLRLARTTPTPMAHVKRVGDLAAHHRTYITKPLDLDETYRVGLRHVLSDLMHLAKLDGAPRKGE